MNNDNQSLQTYRTMKPLVIRPKPRSGLLLQPKRPPPHKCKLPSFFWHKVLFWLPSIKENDLYRCPECLQIYMAGYLFEYTWVLPLLSEEKWKSAGGDV